MSYFGKDYDDREPWEKEFFELTSEERYDRLAAIYDDREK